MMDEQAIQRIVESAVQQAFERIIEASRTYQVTHYTFKEEVRDALRMTIQEAIRSVQYVYEHELYIAAQQNTATILKAVFAGAQIQKESNEGEE